MRNKVIHNKIQLKPKILVILGTTSAGDKKINW